MTEHTSPLPSPSELSAPHWRAAARGTLLVQRCDSCARFCFPPSIACPHCFGRELSWVESSGRGTIHTHSVVWRPQDPAFPVPYIVIVAELDEGFHMFSNLVECSADEVRSGLPIEVVFDVRSESIGLPKFRLVRPPDHS